jgi:short-subunit dehydrogenase
MKSACIIGATSTLGRALGEKLQNVPLLLASRDTAFQKEIASDWRIRNGASIEEASFDSTKPEAFPELAARVLRLPGHRVVFFTPGDAESGKKLDSADAIEQTLRTNLTSAILFFGSLLTQSDGRALQATTVVIVGSIAGVRGRAANPVYSAAKAGLHAFAEALDQKMNRSGGRCCLVVLGYMDSPMSRGLCPPWAAVSPEFAASRILKAVEKGKSRVVVPAIWRPILAAIQIVPSSLWRRLRF